MAIFETELHFDSTDRTYIRNLTPVVDEIIGETQTENGIVTLSSLHTTLVFALNEGKEPNLLLDLTDLTQRMIPEDVRSNWAKGMAYPEYPFPTAEYRHYCGDNPLLLPGEVDDERNAARHARAMVFGAPTLQRPYRGGKMVRGRFQDVLLIELDGRDGSDGNPIRERKIHVEVNSYEEVIQKLGVRRLPPNARL